MTAKLVFFVSEDWYFCSHRLPLAIAAKNAGYEVFVITRVQHHGDQIRAAGLSLISIDLVRRGKNPFVEFRIISKLWKIYRSIEPDIVHHVAIKPVIYGSFAARLAGVPCVVNALAGLGYFYSSETLKARLALPLMRRILKTAINLNTGRLILQNPDDAQLLHTSKVADRRIVTLIHGSGVNLNDFAFVPEPNAPPLVILAARMLWDKGIREFVDAARVLRGQGLKARFALVGEVDSENPSAISEQQLSNWRDEGIVEVWGQKSNMPSVIAESHISCLPSYREGLPKALIEAAACGRPIVATDVPGCRDVVEHGYNGYLVPVRNSIALASALKKLILSPGLRVQMGVRGRKLAEDKFSLDSVVADTLELYKAVTG